VKHPIPLIGSAMLVALLAGSAPAQEKLSAILTHHLEKVTSYLGKAEKAVEAKDTRQAKTCLGEAETYWKTFHEWNAGKFDPAHPRIQAAAERLRRSHLFREVDLRAEEEVLPVDSGEIPAPWPSQPEAHAADTLDQLDSLAPPPPEEATPEEFDLLEMDEPLLQPSPGSIIQPPGERRLVGKA